MGLPNDDTCIAYLECGREDSYAQVAYLICLNTSDGDYSNCVRDYLVGKYQCNQCNQSTVQNIKDHAAAFADCFSIAPPLIPQLPSLPEVVVAVGKSIIKWFWP